MDPNTALAEIRALIEQINNAGLHDDGWGMADELAVLVQGLDNWLSLKGFLPDAWKR